MSFSFDETWDDSALLDSWNEAVEEYKYYHSLHARGEKVEDVLRAVDEAKLNRVGNLASKENGFGQDGTVAAQDVNVTNGEVDDGEIYTEDGGTFASANTQPQRGLGQSGIASRGGAMPSSTTFPDVMLDQDEALKNLMMSWYYAGYYTGLYEGQQQVHQASQAQQAQQTGEK